MARETFTGTLKQTQIRATGPAGQPVTQVLFDVVEDGTPAVAVWHDQPAPTDLSEGSTYNVEGSYVYHKGRHFFFQPVIELVEESIPAPMRHIMLRPHDWQRVHKVIVGASAAAIIALIGIVMALGGSGEAPKAVTSQPVSSRQQTNASQAAGTNSSTSSTTAQATPAADCDSRVVPFTSTTNNDPNTASGTRKVVTAGVAGTDKVCYPNGRDKPSVVTNVQKPVNEVVSVGTKPAASTQTATQPAPNTTTQPQTQPNPSPAPNPNENVTNNGDGTPATNDGGDTTKPTDTTTTDTKPAETPSTDSTTAN